MTENKIKLIGALIGATLLVGFCFAIYGVTFSCGPEGVPETKAIEFYSDDSCYTTVIGQIEEYIDFEHSKEMNFMRISTGDIKYMCDLPATSADVLRRNEFDFFVGGVYKFKIGKTHYGKIHVEYPLVAVCSVTSDSEYLSYDVGKANLLALFIDNK